LIGLSSEGVRLTVGALNEAWELVSTRFIQNPMAKDYVGRLDPAGQQAFAELKRQFGGSNLLNAVRNNYAFHYPRSDEAEDAFEAAFSDKGLDGCWNFYFSQHGFNSLFFLSDLIFVHGIGRKAGEIDLEETQRNLMGEVSRASTHLIEFAKAFVAAAWIKHFGVISTISEQHCPRFEIRQRGSDEAVVVCIAGCQRKPHRQSGKTMVALGGFWCADILAQIIPRRPDSLAEGPGFEP
jgi:hypothetical protein